MKKKVAIFLLLICLCFTVTGCAPQQRKVETIERIWDITLPKNMTIEFQALDPGLQDGAYFSVFKLKTTPTEFIADFSNTKNLQFEKEVDNGLNLLHETTTMFQKKIIIPEDYFPNWNITYYWKSIGKKELMTTGRYSDWVYMIYFPDSLQLFIYEWML